MTAPSCTTCRHRHETLLNAECWHPTVTAKHPSVLSGDGRSEQASILRRYGHCGLEGGLWESRRGSPHVAGGAARPSLLERIWEAMGL